MRIIKRLVLILGTVCFSASTFAAGIDSRSYTCANLQALITAQRFVFINNPDFLDFVVADVYYCGGPAPLLQLRNLPTLDRPECPVNYCIRAHTNGGGN
jgi:hypothetical protein